MTHSQLPYLLLFQTLKTLGRGATVAYFTNFGTQRETAVRKSLSHLVKTRHLRQTQRRSIVTGRLQHVYTLTSLGMNALWRGRV